MRLRFFFFYGIKSFLFIWLVFDFIYNCYWKLWNFFCYCWFCLKRLEVVGWLELELGIGKSLSLGCCYLLK